MSKKVTIQIICPKCDTSFDSNLYRTIWGEDSKNRELVMSNQINVVTCPSCNISTKIPLPFMYSNAPKHFAVWWEPEHDTQIDKDMKEYISYEKRLGVDLSYLSSAPRVREWDEFKETIKKFEKNKKVITRNTKQLTKKSVFSWFDTKELIRKDELTDKELLYIKGKSITFLAPFNIFVRKHWDLVILFILIPNIIGFGLKSLSWVVYIPMVFYLLFSISHSRRLSWNRNKWKSFKEFEKSEENWEPWAFISIVLFLVSLF